jgi:Ser/Thr protein kinase RdoA (MazF antagonist)
VKGRGRDAAGAGTPPRHPYDALTPDVVLDAVESIGFETDGRQFALNSFENRVYQLGLTDRRFVVAKFYRPGRWSDAAIAEEHALLAELADAELPVVVPETRDGTTLFRHAGFRFAVFPRRGGRAPELEQADTAQWLGRTLARLHAVGARAPFRARPAVDVDAFVRAAKPLVLASGLVPPRVDARYAQAVDQAAQALDAVFAGHGPLATLRLHGDCHAGNVLWTDQGPMLVDFDDARSGPAVQDLWMLMTGAPAQRDALLEGYGQFRDFDAAELALVEPLRLMRQIHYAGWLAARWDDPAFPRAFPWAAQPRYWETHVQDILDAVDALA